MLRYRSKILHTYIIASRLQDQISQKKKIADGAMGFIFAGRAYRRPQYVPPAPKPNIAGRQQNITGIQTPQANPQISGHAMPQPAGQVIKRGGNLETPKAKKRAKRDMGINLENQYSREISNVLPISLGPQLAVFNAGPPILGPSRAPTLMDLPPEILYRIYCFAGFGKSNQLSHTCMELFTLFDISQNDYFLLMLVQSNALIDISKKIATGRWPQRFMKKYETLPETFRASPVMERAFHHPINAANTIRALDCSIFAFPGMDARHVKLVKSRFGGIVVDRASAVRQRKRKRRYLEWRYMVFKKFVALALQDPDASARVLLDEAEALEPCANFMKTHKLVGFEPLLESGAVPHQMFLGVGIRRLRVISELKHLYGMAIDRPALLVNSVYKTRQDFPEAMLDELFALDFERSATESDVLETLRAFDEFRYKILDIPEELRETSELLHAVIRYYEFLKDILTFHFESHPQDNSNMIWESLKEIQIPELLDHVVGLGVTVPLDIF